MKIFVNNTFYDKFLDEPEDVIKRGYLSVGFREGGGYHTGFVQSPLAFREKYRTPARIIVEEHMADAPAFTKFTCVTDYGHADITFYIFPEYDWEKTAKIIERMKKEIVNQKLDGSLLLAEVQR